MMVHKNRNAKVSTLFLNKSLLLVYRYMMFVSIYKVSRNPENKDKSLQNYFKANMSTALI